MRVSVVSALAITLALSACGKEPAAVDPAAGADTATVEAAAEADTAAIETPLAPTDNSVLPDDETARKQALLDYATMEDSYINDPKGQWAATATASSAYGNAGMNEGDDPMASNAPGKVIGTVDGDTWSNNNTSIGFDWIEIGIANPVSANEIRSVLPDGRAAEAISKIELIDDAGTLHTVLSGVSPFKKDARGPRTWVVQSFDSTSYKVTGAKVTFANALMNGYTEVDAIQISGE